MNNNNNNTEHTDIDICWFNSWWIYKYNKKLQFTSIYYNQNMQLKGKILIIKLVKTQTIYFSLLFIKK